MRTVFERFFAGVDTWGPLPAAGLLAEGRGRCWIWAGSTATNGYPQMRILGTKIGVHRVSYILHNDHPILPGFEIDHLCRNKRCVSPAHLEMVTHAENVKRSDHRCRRKTRCPRNHPYTGTNSRGDRICQTCANDNRRAA